LSIVYSVFGFFLGYHLYQPQFEFFTKIKKWIYGYAFLSFGLRWDFLIDRNAYAFWFAQLRRNWALKSVLALILLYILYVISFTSLTVILILLIVLGIRYIKNYNQFKLVAFTGLAAFATLFALAMPYLKLYKADTDSIFGDVLHVYAQHPWFWIDPNSSWRLVFWYRMLIENFPQNLLGIGIGTPLLPYTVGLNSTGLPVDDQTLAHVIGTHNTFVTIFVRFGIVSTILFGIIYNSVFSNFFKKKGYYLTNRNDGGIFFGFVTLTCVGLFNLLIESPTLACLYWVSLGFVTKAIVTSNDVDQNLQKQI
jgi:O-antigen ligase